MSYTGIAEEDIVDNKENKTFKRPHLGDLVLDGGNGLGQIIEVCEGMIFNEYRIRWFGDDNVCRRYGEESTKIYRRFLDRYVSQKRVRDETQCR